MMKGGSSLFLAVHFRGEAENDGRFLAKSKWHFQDGTTTSGMKREYSYRMRWEYATRVYTLHTRRKANS